MLRRACRRGKPNSHNRASPGVPQSATVAAGTPYLRSAGVDFVAYGYGNEPGEPAQHDAAFLSRNGPGCFPERIAAAAAAAQGVVLKLRNSEPVISGDGARYGMAPGSRAARQGTGIAAVKASAGFR